MAPESRESEKRLPAEKRCGGGNKQGLSARFKPRSRGRPDLDGFQGDDKGLGLVPAGFIAPGVEVVGKPMLVTP